MEAAIILQMCPKKNQAFAVRTQKMEDNDWYRTWAFPITPKRASREGYDRTPVRGNLFITDDFPGCPHCGSNNFLQCGTCKKISCWNGEEKMVCPWCKTKLNNIVTATDAFDLSGGDI